MLRPRYRTSKRLKVEGSRLKAYGKEEMNVDGARLEAEGVSYLLP